ncbi:HNH endonuclease [Kosakonia cowanii]|uniref:HNH endonuclease n=1 Tax=Kosakonia cowanii TaxID=208223 RepID=UPI003D64AB06
MDVPDPKGNRNKNPGGDFGKADARASKGGANYDLNTWHHHENGVTVMEVPKDIHERFRHRRGVSAIKRKLCRKDQE